MTALFVFSASRQDTGAWTAATRVAPYCKGCLDSFAANHVGEVIDVWQVAESVQEGTSGWDIEGEELDHVRSLISSNDF